MAGLAAGFSLLGLDFTACATTQVPLDLSSAASTRLSCKQGSGKEAGKSAKENQEGLYLLEVVVI